MCSTGRKSFILIELLTEPKTKFKQDERKFWLLELLTEPNIFCYSECWGWCWPFSRGRDCSLSPSTVCTPGRPHRDPWHRDVTIFVSIFLQEAPSWDQKLLSLSLLSVKALKCLPGNYNNFIGDIVCLATKIISKCTDLPGHYNFLRVHWSVWPPYFCHSAMVTVFIACQGSESFLCVWFVFTFTGSGCESLNNVDDHNSLSVNTEREESWRERERDREWALV